MAVAAVHPVLGDVRAVRSHVIELVGRRRPATPLGRGFALAGSVDAVHARGALPLATGCGPLSGETHDVVASTTVLRVGQDGVAEGTEVVAVDVAESCACYSSECDQQAACLAVCLEGELESQPSTYQVRTPDTRRPRICHCLRTVPVSQIALRKRLASSTPLLTQLSHAPQWPLFVWKSGHM